MQVKVVISTIAFMLTMIVFGYAALREPARMEQYTLALEGNEIEKGAALFHSNCATCHGEDGKAQACVDGEGNSIACAGLPLNNPQLLCVNPDGSMPLRLQQMSWKGTPLGYIQSTITVGRPVNGMPTWGSEYGGPLDPYQVGYIGKFITNWTAPGPEGGICDLPTPTPVPWPVTVGDLAEAVTGDATAGKAVYDARCSSCHGDPTQAGSNAVGPWSGAFKDVAATRKDGYTAHDYVYESVMNPNAFIAPDCPSGPCASPSGMPANFSQQLQLQDMADLLAYLLDNAPVSGDVQVMPDMGGGESSEGEGAEVEETPAPAEEATPTP